jgi:hypothetical protein
MKPSVFWDIIPCTLLKVSYLLGLFFDPEDGVGMLLRNVVWLSSEYTTLYPRRLYTCSGSQLFAGLF